MFVLLFVQISIDVEDLFLCLWIFLVRNLVTIILLHIILYIILPLNKRSFMVDLSACLTDFTSASQTSPIQGKEGGLNFHFISDSSKYFLTELSSSLVKASFNSLSAPLKFVPFSQVALLTYLVLALKHLKVKINELVDKPLHTSICIALVVKHVN